MLQPVPVALTTLATLALCAGALLPLNAATRTGRFRRALHKCGALVSDMNDRIVPVTRRRLRPQGRTRTWPALLPNAIDADSVAERTAAVRALADGDGAGNAGYLLAAIAREEEGELRMLAFRALIARKHGEGRDVFREALRSGSDAERSMAIDGLARLDAFDELSEAFADRLEPLAAKAVLLYSAARDRSRALEVLDERVDPGRRDAILTLLAGVLDA